MVLFLFCFFIWSKKQFMKRLVILSIHLIMLSISIYLRPVDQDKPLLGEAEDWQDVARYCFEGGTVVGVLSYLIVQQGGEILNQGLVGFLKQTVNGQANRLEFTVQKLTARLITVQRTGQTDISDFKFIDIGLYTTQDDG